jgi:hypothetical protein
MRNTTDGKEKMKGTITGTQTMKILKIKVGQPC